MKVNELHIDCYSLGYCHELRSKKRKGHSRQGLLAGAIRSLYRATLHHVARLITMRHKKLLEDRNQYFRIFRFPYLRQKSRNHLDYRRNVK